jgi:hypothetical protein
MEESMQRKHKLPVEIREKASHQHGGLEGGPSSKKTHSAASHGRLSAELYLSAMQGATR